MNPAPPAVASPLTPSRDSLVSSALFGSAPFHLVALSGGKDSTALAFALRDKMPDVDFKFYCTPTGDELDEMFEWWNLLGAMLGSKIIPIMEMTLEGCIEKNGMLPNFRARFCTRQIKIEPARRVLATLRAQGEVNHYVGLRADEETRVGGVYDDLGITNQFPFREWGWGLSEVWECLNARGIVVPERTDCALCYHQQIGEWWRLWKNHPKRWAKGEAIEAKYGHTFRTPGRDTWPTSLADLRKAFESGRIPKSERQPELFARGTMNGGACRVCSL